MKNWIPTLSLSAVTVLACLSANARYELNGELVVTPYRNPLLLLSVASAVGAVWTLNETIKKSTTVHQQVNHPIKQPNTSAPISVPISQQAIPSNYDTDYDIIAPVLSQPVPQVSLMDRLTDYFLSRTGSTIFNASETGCGKSTFLFKFMAEILAKSKGQAEFSIIDAKGAYWPLEEYQDGDGNSRVVLIDSTNTETLTNSLQQAVEKLRYVNSVRAQRDNHRIALERQGQTVNFPPLVLVIDEWVMLRQFLSTNKTLTAEIDQIISTIIYGGRESSVFLYLTGQSHRCNITGLPTGARSNMVLISMNKGSQGKDSAILKDIINDSWAVPSASDRKQLAESLALFQQSGQKFIYTSCGGHVIEYLPTMSKEQNQSELKQLLSQYYGQNESTNVIPFASKKTETNDDYWAS